MTSAEYNSRITAKASKNNILVVFPFCARDADCAVNTMRWMSEIGQSTEHNVLLSYCLDTPPFKFRSIFDTATKCFNRVDVTSYLCEPYASKWKVLPHNYAFRHVARYVADFVKRPWLWQEPDMIPVKPEWLNVLQAEYNRAGKAFMGSIVKGMGHANGTCVYPADTPARIPKALAENRIPWDGLMKNEMIKDCHDATHLMYHSWGIHEGHLHPTLGTSTKFTAELLKEVPATAVTVHRCKDGSLIDLLRK